MKPYENMSASNTALVVIDIVNGCCHEDCEDAERGIRFSKIRDMVQNLERFIEEFRARIGGKIIFANLTPWTKEYLPRNLQELYTDPEAEYYGGGGFGEEFYLLKPKEGDPVITKNTYDTFSNPDFQKILKENGIRYLVMTGVFTDGCVLATICGGFREGYNFVILKDLIETTDVPIRQELAERLKKHTFPFLYGKTLTADEFLASW